MRGWRPLLLVLCCCAGALTEAGDAEPVEATTAPWPGAVQTADHVPPFFEYDEEEFEGIPAPSPPPQKEPPAEAPPPGSGSIVQEALKWLAHARQVPTTQEHFWFEGLCTMAMLVYAANFVRGQRANERVARRWAEQHLSLFRREFSHVGTGPVADHNGLADPLLLKDGPAYLEFYASGRPRCSYCLVALALRPRHDLLSLTRPTPDTLLMEVGFGNGTIEPLCLVVASSVAVLADVRRRHLDVCTYSVTPLDPLACGLPPEMQVLTDGLDHTHKGFSGLLPDAAVDTIARYRDHFISLHVSDELCTLDQQLAREVAHCREAPSHHLSEPLFGCSALHLHVRLATEEDHRSTAELLLMAFQLIDHFALLKLPASIKQRNMLHRAQVHETTTARREEEPKGSPASSRKGRRAPERPAEAKAKGDVDRRRRQPKVVLG